MAQCDASQRRWHTPAVLSEVARRPLGMSGSWGTWRNPRQEETPMASWFSFINSHVGAQVTQEKEGLQSELVVWLPWLLCEVGIKSLPRRL